MPSTEYVISDCCIVGGGLAGLMLGYLLARAGLQVVVLEKHADFLRDFRGDNDPSFYAGGHASVGPAGRFAETSSSACGKAAGGNGGEEVTMADFSRLPLQCRFIAFMPQWDFLNFLAEQSAQFPGFTLLKSTSLSQLIIEEGEVRGVLALQSGQPVEIRSRLVVGADGRNSAVRAQAGLVSQHFGSPRDVLWFRLNKQPEDPQSGMGHTGPRNNVIVIDRGDYWQCGLTIEKGQFEAIQARGLDAMKHNIATVSPFSVERLAEIDSWESFKLLSIRIDRLNQWAKPGVLCIGDAAHAMSPIGGVGVNLAIQDAVATANLLTRPLLKRKVTFRDLKKVQQRRQFPTVATQFLQIKMSSKKKPGGEGKSKMPGIIRKYPFLRFIFGRLIGMGFRMEKPRAVR
ncbi:FAD-dependent oxidoreductase [Pantoea ananatis]